MTHPIHHPRRPRPTERGQATAEYALVLLGAGAIAMLVVAWATKSNRVGALLDAVFKSLIGTVT
jgi:Flp pilus assembly pilin Flp